jgi:hypothetical protein|tara:strand:+ start:42 stop:518 length:477 start_codon:yes stop_codon:yes gene_type:complete
LTQGKTGIAIKTILRVKMYKPLMFATILLSGCSIHMAPLQEQVVKKVPAQIEMKLAEQGKHAPWPKEGKEYWHARYFHTMASHPGIQKQLKPEDVFEIVKCTMKKYEEDYPWEWFLKNLANVKILSAENTQYVYIVTKACADIQKSRKGAPIGVGATI